jgi:hypothetical protein
MLQISDLQYDPIYSSHSNNLCMHTTVTQKDHPKPVHFTPTILSLPSAVGSGSTIMDKIRRGVQSDNMEADKMDSNSWHSNADESLKGESRPYLLIQELISSNHADFFNKFDIGGRFRSAREVVFEYRNESVALMTAEHTVHTDHRKQINGITAASIFFFLFPKALQLCRSASPEPIMTAGDEMDNRGDACFVCLDAASDAVLIGCWHGGLCAGE